MAQNWWSFVVFLNTEWMVWVFFNDCSHMDCPSCKCWQDQKKAPRRHRIKVDFILYLSHQMWFLLMCVLCLQTQVSILIQTRFLEAFIRGRFSSFLFLAQFSWVGERLPVRKAFMLALWASLTGVCPEYVARVGSAPWFRSNQTIGRLSLATASWRGLQKREIPDAFSYNFSL